MPHLCDLLGNGPVSVTCTPADESHRGGGLPGARPAHLLRRSARRGLGRRGQQREDALPALSGQPGSGGTATGAAPASGSSGAGKPAAPHAWRWWHFLQSTHPSSCLHHAVLDCTVTLLLNTMQAVQQAARSALEDSRISGVPELQRAWCQLAT